MIVLHYMCIQAQTGSWFIVSSSVFVQLISLLLNQASDVVEWSWVHLCILFGDFNDCHFGTVWNYCLGLSKTKSKSQHTHTHVCVCTHARTQVHAYNSDMDSRDKLIKTMMKRMTLEVCSFLERCVQYTSWYQMMLT